MRVKLVVTVGLLMLITFTAATVLDVEFAYRVSYEGETVGYVDSAEMLDEIEAAVLADIKTDKAEPYMGETKLSLSVTVGSKVDSAANVAHNILENEDSLRRVCVLTVDGETALAVSSNEKALEDVLKCRLDCFATGSEDEVSFLSDIKIIDGYVLKTEVSTLASAKEYIASTDVKTVKTESYVDEIPFETKQTKSADYLKGYVKVTNKGVKGQADVTAVVTCVNGVETARDIIESNTITEPVAQQEVVGTATISKTTNTQYASGNSQFMWPLGSNVRQFITSYMGDGRGHKGLDIACAKGTKIMASMGGTVVYARYRSDYGNFVVIDHGNGYRTVYAHASKLLVREGQVVEKGENIALVGSTGQSTGNHLHFEIRINGVAVNPLRYTSK